MDIRINSIESFAEGRAFGKAGPYERLKGVACGELDPLAPQNSGIVDLDKAPRNARGLVEYEVDIDILRPVDPARGNGVLFYEVTNRGNKILARLLHGVLSPNPTDLNDPKTAAHAGNGFLFERGATLVWAGWDPTVGSRDATMTVRFPLTLEDGKPMVRRIREEFQVGKRIPETFKTIALTYPAASLDKSRARLMMRDREGDPRVEIPRDAWAFVDDRHVRLLPEGTGLKPLTIYEFWYDATNSRVTGISFAMTRDLISFLRNDAASPLVNRGLKHSIAFGISQSGRFLRHFIELGMNRDLNGRRVFDGVFAHTGGATKIFANHSFAEPNRTASQHHDRLYPDAWYPFSTAATLDPFSGRNASLLRGDGSDPLFIQTNTSAEYWNKGASLLTIDALGRADLSLPETSRVYVIAGTQHASSAPTAEPGAVAAGRHGCSCRDHVLSACARFCHGALCQRHHHSGRLDRSAGQSRQQVRKAGWRIRCPGVVGRCRWQRDIGHSAAAGRRTACDLHRLERLSRSSRGARRSRRLLCAVHCDEGRAYTKWRHTAVARGTLRLARRLRCENEGVLRPACRRASAAAGRCQGLCRCGESLQGFCRDRSS
jgi:hypothetical protein